MYLENPFKAIKGQHEWLQPDLVDVYFPFIDYKSVTNHLSITSSKLFYFELKISLNFAHLSQSYFQVFSNSSWTYEGYLVAVNIDDDPTFKDEVKRLNNAFGIGIIKLNPENVFESEVLFPASINQQIDWDPANRLANENSDFSDFLKLITEDCKLGIVKSKYDTVLQLEELTTHINNKGINKTL